MLTLRWTRLLRRGREEQGEKRSLMLSVNAKQLKSNVATILYDDIRGIGKMFASAGDNQLAIIFHVPSALTEKLTLKEWVDTVTTAINGEIVEIGDEVAKVKVAADQAAGRFPLKMRDEAIAAGLGLLKSRGLIPAQDDSDDDVNYAEAAGVEW